MADVLDCRIPFSRLIDGFSSCIKSLLLAFRVELEAAVPGFGGIIESDYSGLAPEVEGFRLPMPLWLPPAMAVDGGAFEEPWVKPLPVLAKGLPVVGLSL